MNICDSVLLQCCWIVRKETVQPSLLHTRRNHLWLSHLIASRSQPLLNNSSKLCGNELLFIHPELDCRLGKNIHAYKTLSIRIYVDFNYDSRAVITMWISMPEFIVRHDAFNIDIWHRHNIWYSKWNNSFFKSKCKCINIHFQAVKGMPTVCSSITSNNNEQTFCCFAMQTHWK